MLKTYKHLNLKKKKKKKKKDNLCIYYDFCGYGICTMYKTAWYVSSLLKPYDVGSITFDTSKVKPVAQKQRQYYFHGILLP